MTPRQWAYFDTSVIVKRYVKEAGSLATRRLLKRFQLLSSSIMPVEAMSAFSRRRASGDLTQRDFLAIRSRLRKDQAYWELVEVSETVLLEAEDLVEKTNVRTLDAIHLASAIVFQSESGLTIAFITGDAKQRDAARMLGFTVIWVE
ncbi:MAG: type II toxin-antitoxin system VapC family toxin [Nitrospira sp.]|nr:type II toxin-antitoxin system VapC family toxin [Nitrospira sp.]